MRVWSKIHQLVQKIKHGNHILDVLKSAGVTLKIRSTSLKSNQLFPSAQQCIYASFGQNPSSISEDNAQKPYFGHFSAPVTLKKRTSSPKSDEFFPFSQQCIYAILVKIHQLVQKIISRNEKQTDGIHTKTIYPHSLRVGGYNMLVMGT